MAAALPAKLKIPGIQPFVSRAAQLEKFKPIISYWCNYHVVNQILSKGLHAADDDCKEYTVGLMDKLEKAKNQEPAVDAIVDDIAAKAYVEQFAVETFQKADANIHSNNATRSTIDTFQAACTFLELLSIWSPLEAETQAQIKYAKYHALRIAKAIKAGEDPNASNPKDEPAPQLDEATEAAIDTIAAASGSANYHPPTVEDEGSGAVPSPGLASAQAPNQRALGTVDVSPAPQPPVEYFPPTAPVSSDRIVPIVTGTSPGITPASQPPPNSSIEPSTDKVEDFYTQQPSQTPPQPYVLPPVQSHPAPAPFVPPPAAIPTPATQPATTISGAYRTDDEAVALAQKHAKWAISALNFEDVPTAVKELRKALEQLGAS